MNQAWRTAINEKGAEKQRTAKKLPLCSFARFVASWFKPHVSGPCGGDSREVLIG
ncbi:MAG: hypothetical protein JWP27_628, partial [Flaviaesturariibacter sp.]|nr:hypothetical protein [Flaviaesturariibacter sp.]